MDGTLTNLLVQLICGAIGGNIAGAIFKKINLGILINSIAGLLGGGLGGQLLSSAGLLDSLGAAGSIGSSTVGGAIILALVSLIKSTTAKAH